MTLQVKDLLFFNKEGNPMNLNFDSDLNMWNGKIYFDKNSTDTYKTQGIYMFEKVPGSNNSLQTHLEKFQVFNTNGFRTYPKYDATELIINNIELVNENSNYNTKWIYADNIEKYFYPGMWCYITGLNGYHNTDFNTINGNLQVRKVLGVQNGKILVWTDTTNNITLAPFIATTAMIVPVNIIEVQQSLTGLPAEPLWNETGLTAKIYNNKKISYITNSENSGIYTIDTVCNDYTRDFIKLSPALFAPTIGDKLKIDIELRTTNIQLVDGVVDFGGSGVSNINIPYIPSFLKIGDTIQAQIKTTPLLLSNLIQYTIIGLDKLTNTITVNTSVGVQIIDCYIYLATNIFTIEQDIVLDNNNTYSLPLTYWTIVNKYKDELLNLPGGNRLEYITETDELHIISDYVETYTSINVNVINSSNIITNYPVLINQYTIYPLFVKEALTIEDNILSDSTLYNRNIIFNSIDAFGLNLRINGITYDVDFDTDINNTIGDFITVYSTVLASIGINISQTNTTVLGDTLNITCDYPNVPVFVELNFGDNTIFYVQYKDIEFNNIKSQLLLNINDNNYIVTFDTNDIITVTKWINTYQAILRTLGILVSNTANKIHFNLLDTEKILDIKYNIGYIPKSGDLSVYETNHTTNSIGSIISGNEIRCNAGVYNFLDYYSTGQKISISGAIKVPQNKSYNIISLDNEIISLSYQGAFWQQGLPVFDLNIISDYFIRFPKYGFSENDLECNINFTWKDTEINDFFFYDFTGNQLKPVSEFFPTYNGIMPLCGPDGEITLKLIDKPNTILNDVNNPVKQQTVFNEIKYKLPFTDDNVNAGIEPDPLQLFIGYNAEIEGWNKARVYMEMIENIKYDVTTNINLTDDLWVFNDNYLELQSPTTTFNFLFLGFNPGQIVQFIATDTNSDGLKIATMLNSGKKYMIKEVQMHKIIFNTDVLPETSVKVVASPIAPYYDISGNAIVSNRRFNLQLNIVPKVIAYFDVYGESESEDERHKINLNNKNLNILKLQDIYIFKDVDISEKGIDWIFLNRKRKELIEIYPEIFNNLSNYKSVIHAINFFGYNDLTFTEYFQNINPESSKFGQLLNMELLNILDKSIDGWEYSNLAYENLRNEGFRKTNLFSLNYKITDIDGNFINAYSLEEVKIKLLGLKKWLTENIIPFGTKILDINGKYVMPQNFNLKHETYMTKNFRVEEYASPVDFKVSGYLQPTTMGSNSYDISVEFFSAETIEWFEYVIRTFDVNVWDENLTYNVGVFVYNNNKIWKCISNTIVGNEPGFTVNWEISNLESLQNIQIARDYMYTAGSTSITINTNVDPHFTVEVYWHSGYATTHKTVKTYSVINGFFD
jgi:hypothetical protein